MPYATLADVQARMPQFQLTPISKPSSDVVPTLIADVEAELDSELSRLGYRVPVDQTQSPRAFQILTAMSAYGAIARILAARTAAVGGTDATKSEERAQKFYDDRIQWLGDPKSPYSLIDALLTGLNVSKPSRVLRIMNEDVYDENDAENWPWAQRARMSQPF